MDRRDFLNLPQAAGAPAPVATPAAALARSECSLLHFSRRAMATSFEVLLPIGTPEALPAAEAALDQIDLLEKQLTVFQPVSEVSRINRLASTAPVVVDERLFQLLIRTEQLHRDTGGAFDITAGALTRTWGFYRRQGRVPTPDELAQARQCVGMHHIELDPERRTVHYQQPGLEINLGSIGKGYALDRAAEVLRKHGLRSAILHGGQSSILAVGSSPGDSRGWPVGIQHPWRRDRRLAVLRLCDRAVGTSAATFQHLEYNKKKLGHVLDPRSGWPAEGLASASAIAPTAAEADALATAFFVLGIDAVRTYCTEHPGTGAVLLPTGNSVPVIVGLTAEDFIWLPPGCRRL